MITLRHSNFNFISPHAQILLSHYLQIADLEMTIAGSSRLRTPRTRSVRGCRSPFLTVWRKRDSQLECLGSALESCTSSLPSGTVRRRFRHCSNSLLGFHCLAGTKRHTTNYPRLSSLSGLSGKCADLLRIALGFEHSGFCSTVLKSIFCLCQLSLR